MKQENVSRFHIRNLALGLARLDAILVQFAPERRATDTQLLGRPTLVTTMAFQRDAYDVGLALL